jgi:trans-2,3-dihydro-3-hydroxyanthranilate isomerase
MTRSYPYSIVDVFTVTPLEGNALAVLPDATGLDAATMQRIAAEFNLSETTFVFPAERADCAARLRIFTPTMEMPFAGHPTVGSAFVLLERGLVTPHDDRFAFEEVVGPVPVRVERSEPLMLWLTTPPISFGSVFDRALCASVLGLTEDDVLDVPPQFASAGNPTIFIALRDAACVDRASLELAGVRTLHGGNVSGDCVFVFTPTPSGAYARMFAPERGIVEDPATGSATGPLAAYMIRHGLTAARDGARFVSEQGTQMGRRSFLHVRIVGERGQGGIEVGGNVVAVAEGTLRF